LFEPRLLRINPRAAKRAARVFFFDTINNQISDGHAFRFQGSRISLSLVNAHRFRNRDKGETRLVFVVQERSDTFNTFTKIFQKEINLVEWCSSAGKLCHHVTMFFRHAIKRSHHAHEDFWQT
jgi:hypothetical protein